MISRKECKGMCGKTAAWSKMAEEEVLRIANTHNEESMDAMDYLLNKYKGMVRKKARKLFLIGADQDDLVQEGMIGLYKAVRSFDVQKDSSFGHFAELCISRQIYDAIKASNRQKNLPLNTYLSFHMPLSGEEMEEGEAGFLMDYLGTKKNQNPEQLVIDKESVSVLQYELVRRLSTLEREVLRYYLDGLSYTEIADSLQREPKSIDNALQRIRNKLSTLLEEREKR